MASSYILRKLPPDLWDQVKAKAKAEDLPLRPLFLALLRAYVAGTITIAPQTVRNEA